MIKLNCSPFLRIIVWLLISTLSFTGDALAVSKKPSFVANAISLKTIGGNLGLKFDWVVAQKIARLSKPNQEMIFEIHKKEMIFNGIKVFLGEPVSLKNRDLFVSSLDYNEVVIPLLAPSLCAGAFPTTVQHIVLDAGHGGKDQGAENATLKLKEKDLTLDVALKTKKLLEQKGFKVSLTRNQDVNITLQERPAFAKRLKADLFISIHFNAAQATSASGIETYSLTSVGQPSTSRQKVDPEDLQIAKGHAHLLPSLCLSYSVQSSLIQKTKSNDRGCRKARFIVLNELDQCPGILIEGGFLTHTQEAEKIATEAYRLELATAIAQGIVRYTKAIDSLKVLSKNDLRK